MANTETDTGPLFQVINSVAPVLATYTADHIIEELWHRPGLSPRDRAIVTVSTLVSRNATNAYPHYFNKSLDSGLKPSELSELITHLAFYASFAYAFGAVAVLKGIFDERGIGADQLPEVSPKLLPIEQAVPDEAIRAGFIDANVAPVSEALKHFTDDLLYHQVWLRPGLSPRDRGLASIATLSAQGQVSFLPFYMGRAVTHGVTRQEIGELLAHTAFYAGWGNAVQAAIATNQFFSQPASL